MFKSFGGTLVWSLWQWLFAGGDGCGFQSFPIFGLAELEMGAYANHHGVIISYAVMNLG